MKIIFKYLKIFFLGISVLFAAYLFFSVIFSIIPVNNDFKELKNSNFELWIKSNGVHLDIVVPIKNEYIDWETILTVPDKINKNYLYVGFGWGDKEFYTSTPEWSDLKFSIAFNALFTRTEGAMHVTYYKNLSENVKSIKLLINKEQFRDVQTYILDSFIKKDDKVVLIEDLNYGAFDNFYEANYKYSLFYTCNTWTNQVLKKSSLPACIWTPVDKGILFQNRKYISK